MARKDAAAALRNAAEAMEDDGNVIEGQLESPAERDAEHIERENRDDILHALTIVEGAPDAVWKVERVLPVESAGWCMDIPTALLSQAYIKKKCGPGKYRVRGWNRGNYVGGRTFNIAQTADDAMPGTAVAAPNLDEFFARIESQRGAWKEDLKFWAGLLASAAPLIVPLISAMMQRKPPRESSITEMVAAMQGLKSLSEPSDPLKQITGIRDLIGAVQDLTPDKPVTGSTWVDLVRDLGTQLAPLAVNVLGARNATPNPTGTVAMPKPVHPGPNQGLPPGTMTDFEEPMLNLITWLRPQLQTLITKAAKNSDPELYAELLADNVPPNITPDQIESFLNRADWWQLLLNVAPNAAPYQGWFTQLRGTLLAMIEEGKPSQVDPNPSNGANNE